MFETKEPKMSPMDKVLCVAVVISIVVLVACTFVPGCFRSKKEEAVKVRLDHWNKQVLREQNQFDRYWHDGKKGANSE